MERESEREQERAGGGGGDRVREEGRKEERGERK